MRFRRLGTGDFDVMSETPHTHTQLHLENDQSQNVVCLRIDQVSDNPCESLWTHFIQLVPVGVLLHGVLELCRVLSGSDELIRGVARRHVEVPGKNHGLGSSRL